MIKPTVANYIENARQDIIKLYGYTVGKERKSTTDIRILALDTLMQLDKCLEQYRSK